MNRSLTIFLGLAAGLAGGLLTRFIAPPAAHAQNQAPVTREIRAQRFTLVDEADRTVGTFMVEGELPGLPEIGSDLERLQDRLQRLRQTEARPRRIVLLDSNGREIWSAGGSLVRPLSGSVR
jgi:hypothetical protein